MSDNEECKTDDFEQLIDTSSPAESTPAAATATAAAPTAGSGDNDGKMLLCCSYLERMDQRVKNIVLWSDPKRSAASLFCILLLLWSCMSLSFISVLAYAALAALLCSCALRLYSYTMKRSASEAIGASCLQRPVQLPRDCIVQFIDQHLKCAEAEVNCLLDLLNFADSVRTLKFFIGLILLTYIGSWFNALTLITLTVITAFCLPKAYAVYHRQVDAALTKLIHQYQSANATIRAAFPFGKDKTN